MEEAAQLCALAADLMEETLGSCDLSESSVHNGFIEPLLSNDINLIVELQGHLAEKKDTFGPLSVTILRNLINDHKSAGDKHVSASSAMEIQVAADDLAASEFKLLMEKAHYDVLLYQNYLLKMSNSEAAAYHERLAYKQRRLATGKKVIAKLMGDNRDGVATTASAKKYQVVHITSKQKTAEVLEDFNGYPLSAK